MINDSKGRFPNNPLWGDGWGLGLVQGSRALQERREGLQGRLHRLPHSGERNGLGIRGRLFDLEV